jgi:hypothetical protein
MNHAGGQETSPETNRWFWLLAVSTCLLSWLAMQAVHELGHVLHAAASGGRVNRVILHPQQISRTDVEPNPHPLFVAWGGPFWGSVIPLVLLVVAPPSLGNIRSLAQFFAGFCLIANGAYIGSGVVQPVGDAEQLLRYGSPVWTLGIFGVVTVGAGLWCWHRMMADHRDGRARIHADPFTSLSILALLVFVVALELALD